MARPSRKDASELVRTYIPHLADLFNLKTLQARSFLITEAEEDPEEEEYGTEDEEYEESQEEELRRQKAESAPLRSRDYDLFANICSRWAQEEAPPAPSNARNITQSLRELNDYDSESDSDELTSPASPAVLPSASCASAGPSAHQDREMEAWTLLDEYLSFDSGTGGEVHDALEKLCVGAEWEAMWGRITGIEPGDEGTTKEVRDALNLMKPTVAPPPPIVNSGTMDDPEATSKLDSPLFDGLQGSEAKELTDEQKDLAQYVNRFLGSVILEEYGVYYLRCHVSGFYFHANQVLMLLN